MSGNITTTEKPILFSDAMVQAILDGRKTQTRRCVKNAPSDATIASQFYKQTGPYSLEATSSWKFSRQSPMPDGVGFSVCAELLAMIRCPYGMPGERLWVKQGVWCYNESLPRGKNGQLKWPKLSFDDGVRWFALHCEYTARMNSKPNRGDTLNKMYAPRWACNLPLEVKSVRVERVQEISEQDAMAEGVDAVSIADVPRQAAWSRRQDFSRLWDSINGKRPGCSWQENPWVWVVEFERVEG